MTEIGKVAEPYRVIEELRAERDALRAELAACKEQLHLTNIDWFQAEAECDALRELLREAREFVDCCWEDAELARRIDALFKASPTDSA